MTNQLVQLGLGLEYSVAGWCAGIFIGSWARIMKGGK
jgi:hypothetical protein